MITKLLYDIFCNIDFWRDFLSNGLATLLGALFGIPIALGLDRKISNKNKNQRKDNLLESIKENLDKNRIRVEAIRQSLETGYLIVLNNVDTVLLDTTYSLRYELINNSILLSKLNEIHKDLELLKRKVDLQLTMRINSPMREKDLIEIRENIIASIIEYCPPLENLIDETIELIDKSISN